jgi:hypothetical protein
VTRAWKHLDRNSRMFLPCWRHVAATLRTRSTNRLPHLPSTSGRTGGISATWCRSGSGSSPCSAAPQPRHYVGLTSKVSRSCSGGTSARVCRWCPACPPRLRPEGGTGGRRLSLTAGGSVEGGLEDLVELKLSRLRSEEVGVPSTLGRSVGLSPSIGGKIRVKWILPLGCRIEGRQWARMRARRHGLHRQDTTRE